MYKKIVMTRTPMRISFLGGGTDISNFYKKNSGIVLSTAINKFIYVTVKEHGPLFFRNYRLNYSKTENKNKLSSIQNDIIRETLKITNIKKPLYISSISDLPSNSGLASSSAFTVGLVKALHEFKNEKITNLEAAKLACEIEINKVKSPIGKQDQYATAIGGFNVLNFKKDSTVIVKKIKKEKIIKEIFDNSVLIWVGGSRKANKILKDQNSRLKINKEKLNLIRKFAVNLESMIKKNYFSIKDFGNLINKSWNLKKNLSKKIVNNRITKIYNFAIENGSLGGKLLGAGGGGFLYMVVKKKDIMRFKKKINLYDKKIRFMDCNYYEKGTEILISIK
jgi:D-glycero-alpha-D-manno-heptose-7-phosphate kinase